ncbi:MAG: hypothetical protein JHC66_01895 [Acidimicrobiia bacterium]|nr:hypothetical protein [Acidimicrobiia bacterium]
MKSRLLKALIGVLAIIGALATSFAVVSAVNSDSDDVTRITIISGVPVNFTYDNPPGGVPGQTTYFVGKVTKPSGEAFGLVTGSLRAVAPVSGKLGEVRLRNLVFKLPEGQIVAMGNSIYSPTQVQLIKNTKVVIAVIGGTGKYIGARGELETNRNDDGTYTYRFTLLK